MPILGPRHSRHKEPEWSSACHGQIWTHLRHTQVAHVVPQRVFGTEVDQIHCHGGTIAANAALPRRIIYVWQVTGVYG